jgi:hypothetical protein
MMEALDKGEYIRISKEQKLMSDDLKKAVAVHTAADAAINGDLVRIEGYIEDALDKQVMVATQEEAAISAGMRVSRRITIHDSNPDVSDTIDKLIMQKIDVLSTDAPVRVTEHHEMLDNLEKWKLMEVNPKGVPANRDRDSRMGSLFTAADGMGVSALMGDGLSRADAEYLQARMILLQGGTESSASFQFDMFNTDLVINYFIHTGKFLKL